jgi:hypothetical protein
MIEIERLPAGWSSGLYLPRCTACHGPLRGSTDDPALIGR